MVHALPTDRMPEAKVSLRLAFYLLSLPESDGTAEVAADDALAALDDEPSWGTPCID